MDKKPTYEELERRVRGLELEEEKREEAKEELRKNEERYRTLLENEERYRLLVETMSDGLGVQDENGFITFVNDRLCKILGYSEKEIIGHPVTDFLDEDNQAILKEQMAGRKKGKRGPYEMIWTKKNGKKIPTIMSPSPIFDAQSNFIGSFAVITDIEDHKRKEEEILQQKEFLNNILESLTHPFYVLDAMDYTIKMANLAAGTDSLTENTTCYALTHKRDKPCGGVEHICPLEQVKKTKKPATAEHIHYDKEGNLRNVEVYAFPIFDNRGNVIQAIEYSLDITMRKWTEEALRKAHDELEQRVEERTAELSKANEQLKLEIVERKRTEEALLESEERHRTLVGNLPVGVYRNTPGPEGQFLMANPAFCKMFGFKNEEEVKDFTPASLYQNPKERKEYSDNLIQKGVIKNDVRTLLKREGNPVYSSITARVV